MANRNLAGHSVIPNFLYRNHGNGNHWLKLKLIGTRSNRSAIGATVRAEAVIAGQERWQLRHSAGGSGFCSQEASDLHFGLGDADSVDLLRIEWPSGIVQELHDVAVNRRLTISEPPTLEPIGLSAAQGFEMTLTSRGGFSYQVNRTTDLLTWTPGPASHDVNGSVQVVDAGAGSRSQSFYQAVEIPRSGSGLVAWWAAEGNALDNQFRFHAQVNGGVSYQDGVFGQAFSIAPTGGWVAPTVPVVTKVDDWSMEAWIPWKGSPDTPIHNDQFIIYSGGTGANGYGLSIVDRNLCSLQPYYCGMEGMAVVLYGGLWTFPTGYFPPTNAWVHVALVRAGGVLQLYVDGQEVYSSLTFDPNPPSSQPTFLSHPSPLSSFNGLIDEARVWNRALSAREVRDIQRVGALRLALPP